MKPNAMLKPYMAYSRSSGAIEGAFLVLAPNIRDAKKLAWSVCSDLVDEFTDLAVRLIRNSTNVLPLADQDKLKANQPHVVDNPVSCFTCGVWGEGLNDDNTCPYCGEYPGQLLIAVFAK